VGSELAKSFGELVGADRVAAGKQPGRGSVIADSGLAAATDNDLDGKRGKRSGSTTRSSPRLPHPRHQHHLLAKAPNINVLGALTGHFPATGAGSFP
jgi:hypothetical protein